MCSHKLAMKFPPDSHNYTVMFMGGVIEQQVFYLWQNRCSLIIHKIHRNASQLILPKRLWKCASTLYFMKYKRKVVLLVIYLFNYGSSKSIFFMLNMISDVVLSTIFVNNFLVSCNIKITRTSFFLLSLCVLICTFL